MEIKPLTDIIELRKPRWVSQAECADYLCMSRAKYINVEKGRAELKVSEYVNLVEWLSKHPKIYKITLSTPNGNRQINGQLEEVIKELSELS